MRIAYNLRDQNWETTKSLGILHVSLRLLAGLAADPRLAAIDVLANRALVPLLPPTLAGHARCRWHFSNEPAPSGWNRLLWDHWNLVRAANRLAPDWLLLPKGFSPLLRWPHARVSAFVHDDIFGYYRSRAERPFPFGQAALFHRCLARTASHAAAIVTNSSFTAAEIQTHFIPRARITSIGAPLPAETTPSRGRVVASTEPLLLPTSSWPHKLTAQAIDWLQRWEIETASHRAVHGFGSLPAGVTWPARTHWIHHGRMPDEALRHLFSAAAALIYFSAYEGYGLPPVEAAAAGVRAIASDLPALRETLPAACLFDNSNYAAFAHALTRALGGPSLPPLRIDTPVDVAARWIDALCEADRRVTDPTSD